MISGLAAAVADLQVQSVVTGAIGGLVIGILIGKALSNLKDRCQTAKSGQNGKMKVYHKDLLRSARVLWIISELGIDDECEIITHNPFKAEGSVLEIYKKEAHPNGSIPALRMPNGDVILESAAICFYLARAYDKLQPPPSMIQHYYSLSVYAVATLDRLLRVLHEQYVMTSEDNRDPALVQETEGRLQEGLAFINAHLQNNLYICGEKFSAADVIIGYTIMWASVYKGGVRLSTHPHLQKYLSRLKARRHFTPSVGSLRDWVMATSPRL